MADPVAEFKNMPAFRQVKVKFESVQAVDSDAETVTALTSDLDMDMEDAAIPQQKDGGKEWRELLRPYAHIPGCPFDEDEFQDEMSRSFLTPEAFDAQLRVEKGARKGRKIAYNPFVLEYLMEQRELVTCYRSDFYNLCDCKLGRQRIKKTPKTLFPSDADRQRAMLEDGFETMPDLFLEKRTSQGAGGRGGHENRKKGKRHGRSGKRRSDRLRGGNAADDRKEDTEDVESEVDVKNVKVKEEHELVKTDAEITKMDVCMALVPLKGLDVFPIMIGQGQGAVGGGMEKAGTTDTEQVGE